MNAVKKRTIAREYAFQFLYHLQLDELDNHDEDIDSALLDFEESTDVEKPQDSCRDFTTELIKGTIDNKDALTEALKKYLHKSVESINRIDLTVLLLGSFELIHLKDAPAKVVINEAINIAKKFGTKDSGSFINGVLDKIVKNEL